MWPIIKLGDAASFINGYAFKPEQWTPSGREIIRIQNLTNSVKGSNFYNGELAKKYKVKKGDLLISWSATIGIFEWDRDDAWLNQHIFKVDFNKKEFDKGFFKYLISSSLRQLENEVHGSTMKHITKKRFDELKIPLPPLETQKKIAAILDKADELRQNDKKILEKYDQLVQSVFLDMFGDIDSNLKYKIISIGDVVTDVKDGPHVSPNYVNEGIPILSTRNIRPFELDLSDMKYVSEGTFKELTKRFKPQRNDILLTKGGTTGYAKLVNWDWEFCIWVHIAALRPDLELINPRYLEAALNSFYCYRQSQKYTHGIANKDLGLKRLINIKFPLPPMEYQNKFSKIFDRIIYQKELSKQSHQKSEELFQSLLQRAFRGELV